MIDSLPIFVLYGSRAFQNTEQFDATPSRTRVRGENIFEIFKKVVYSRLLRGILGQEAIMGIGNFNLVRNPFINGFFDHF